MQKEDYMQRWDEWREYIAAGGGGSWPRDAFESFVDKFLEREDECRFLQSRLDYYERCLMRSLKKLQEEVVYDLNR